MTSLASRLEEHLHPERMRVLRVCAGVAERRDIDLYLVGGAVRDTMLAPATPTTPSPPSSDTGTGTGIGDTGTPDLDIAGPSIDRGFASEVAEALGGRFVASSAFGTYKLIVPNAATPETAESKVDPASGADIEIDLVTSRSETYAEPGALPDVSPGSVADDLARRDFSVGAMCMVLAPPTGSDMTWGDLIDPFDGEGDIERKLIRVLHPESFIDDPTRIFRAVRYGARLGFGLETGTGKLLRSALGYIQRLSGDRVRHELERIFDEAQPGEILAWAQEMGVLKAVFEEMGADADVLVTAKFPAGEDGRDAWAGLLAYPVPPQRSQALSKRLNLGSRTGRVVRDVAGICFGFHGLRSGLARKSEIYSFLSYRTEAAIRACAAATEDETLRVALNIYLDELIDVEPSLTGHDIQEMGVPQGPVVGQLLRQLLYARLDGEVTTPEQERAFVQSRLGLISEPQASEPHSAGPHPETGPAPGPEL
jgi:tRNA nucleotidyltransferase (CCA-adding enzyme)